MGVIGKGLFMVMKRKRKLCVTLALGMATAGLSGTAEASCSMEAHLGSVCMTAATFCPRGTTEAKGQLLAISQYSALFSLLGTRYGGDGRTTFALPDLQASAPVSVKSGKRSAMKYCVVMQGTYPSRP